MVLFKKSSFGIESNDYQFRFENGKKCTFDWKKSFCFVIVEFHNDIINYGS